MWSWLTSRIRDGLNVAGPDDVIVYGPTVDTTWTAQEADDELPPLDDNEPEDPPFNWNCYRCGQGGIGWSTDWVIDAARQHARDMHPGIRMTIEED